MEPRKTEGSACPPIFDAPKNQATEPAPLLVSGEKTPPAYGPGAGETPAPAPASPVRPPLPRWMVPAALFSWLWGWAYARGLLFGFEYGPVFMALFCLAFFAGVEWMYRAANRPAPKESRLWLALWGLLAADYIFKISALYYYDAVQTWEFLALHLAAAYWVLARTGSLTEGRTGPFLLLDTLRALVILPFGNFFLRIRVLLRALTDWLRGLSGRKKGNFWAGVVTLCVAVPVLALAAALFESNH